MDSPHEEPSSTDEAAPAPSWRDFQQDGEYLQPPLSAGEDAWHSGDDHDADTEGEGGDHAEAELLPRLERGEAPPTHPLDDLQGLGGTSDAFKAATSAPAMHPGGYSSETIGSRTKLPPSHRHPMVLGIGPRAAGVSISRRASVSKRAIGYSSGGDYRGRGPTDVKVRPYRVPKHVEESTELERRCTVYCCALSLDVVGLAKAQPSGHICTFYKDGINMVMHTTRRTNESESSATRGPGVVSPPSTPSSAIATIGFNLNRVPRPTAAPTAAGAPAASAPATNLSLAPSGILSAANPTNAAGPSAPAVAALSSSAAVAAAAMPVSTAAEPSVTESSRSQTKLSATAAAAAAALGAAIDDAEEHAFFFSYGCIVFWGFSEEDELQIKAQVKAKFAIQPLAQDEVDDFDFAYALPGTTRPALHKDVIQLSTREATEKLAVSFALAQSAKLGVFEVTIEKTIAETREIPEGMAKTGKISLKRRDITRRIGQLFVDRASINLHSDILEHPDFFWEDDEYLSVYQRVSKYLEVERRVEVLNKRLDLIKELFDMLASELHTSHSNTLEWIVIILILVEVFFQILELFALDGFGAGLLGHN